MANLTTAKLPLPRSLPVVVGVRVMARAQARALVRAAALAELVVLLHLALLEETHGAEARGPVEGTRALAALPGQVDGRSVEG